MSTPYRPSAGGRILEVEVTGREDADVDPERQMAAARASD
jgi:hypothetical protein